MNNIHLVLSILIFCIVSTSLIIPVHAIYLDAVIHTNEQSAKPLFKFAQSIFVKYPEGGKIAERLKGQNMTMEFSANSTTSGVSELITRINKNLLELQSNVVVTDLKVDYTVHLEGNDNSAVIDYNMVLTPTITNHILREGTGNITTLIDAQWRGISINGPVIIHVLDLGDVDINSPIGFFKIALPDVYSEISGTNAEAFLNKDVIDAKTILDQPLDKWLHLFDPLGQLVETEGYSYKGEKIPFTTFSMGESSIREGQQREKIENIDFITDKKYTIQSIQYHSIGVIKINGIVRSDIVDGREYFGASTKTVEGYGTFSTGKFPVVVVYGMAGLAVVGAVVFFMFSNRSLKNQKVGQQGIDPSRLISHQTSLASGGYHTNRGESQLIDDTSYQKTRSVYDEQKQESSSKGAMPKGWEPETK